MKNKLDECRDLIRRLCNLPTNDEELKKDFSEEEINDIRQTILMFDPDASYQVKRFKEIMDYIDGKKTLLDK